MGSLTVLLLIIVLSMVSSTNMALAAIQEYTRIVEFGEPLSIVYSTNPNTTVMGSLFAAGEGIVFWVTSPSGRTVAGDPSSWAGEFSHFEFAAQEGGAYTFHLQNRLPSSYGAVITLTIDSRRDQNSLVLLGLLAAVAIVGMVVGLLLWRSKKLKQKTSEAAQSRGRRRLVRVTMFPGLVQKV
jgi:hypothetical protein